MEATSVETRHLPEHPQIAPALSLPPEILSHILSLSGHSLTGPSSLQLAHVCRRWRQVLLGLSEYWVDVVASSKFHQETDISFLTFILTQSSPRQIRLNSIRLSPSITTVLAPNWHRVVSLDVKISNQDHLRSLHAVLQYSQPSSLRELFLTSSSTDRSLSQSDLVPLPHGSLPALRHLFSPISYLSYITVSSLCHLEVSSWPGHPPEHDVAAQTLSRLFDSLAICTELETLSIYSPSTRGLEVRPSSRIIHLYRLQRLYIRDGCPIRTNTILSTLKFRDPTTISVDCSGRRSLSGLHEMVSHAPPGTDTARMTICDGSFLVVDLLEGSTPRFRVEVGLHVAFLNHAVRIFPESPSVTALEWSSDGQRSLTAGFNGDWGILLPSFPSLTRFSVRRLDPVALAFALRLHYRDLPPCPSLTEITVAWNADEMESEMVFQERRWMRQEQRAGRKVTRDLSAVGATPAARARAVAEVIAEALVLRAEHKHVLPLARVELSEYDLGGALSAEAARAVEDELAMLRTLVHGSVVFTKMTGTIATPSSTCTIPYPLFPARGS